MKTSDTGLALIKRHEGLKLDAYRCPAGIWTIGYGHTTAAGAPAVTAGSRITRQEAEDILRSDLGKFERAVLDAVTVPLSQPQFDALVSLCFNIGPGAFAKSTLVRVLNAGRREDVPKQWMRWTKGGGRELPGLVKRRRDELALWRGVNDHHAPDGVESRTTPDPVPPGKPATQSTTIWAAIAATAAAVLKPVADVVTDWRALSVVASVVIVGAAVWVIRERLRHAREDGV